MSRGVSVFSRVFLSFLEPPPPSHHGHHEGKLRLHADSLFERKENKREERSDEELFGRC